MNLMELKKALKEDRIDTLYVFYGIEYAVLDVYITKLKEKFNGKCCSFDSVRELVKKISSFSLLGDDSNTLYVVREDKDFQTDDALWDILEQRLKAKNSSLILKYSTLDKRSKFYKRFGEIATEFDRMSDSVVIKHIKQELGVDSTDAKELAVICGYDYGRLLLEMNKVINYAQYHHISNTDAIRIGFNTGMFYKEVEGEIYDLINAFMSRDINRIKKSICEFKCRGDNPIAFVSILHNTAKAILQIKCIGRSNKMSEVTGLTPYQIKNGYNYVNCFSTKELIRIIKYCKYCDNCVKSGSLDANMVVDYMIVNCL